MTDTFVQERLIERFKQINELTGKQYIDNKNVAYPNRTFIPPEDKRWFELYFLPDEPIPAGLGEYSADRYTGILQIDICVKSGLGDDEAIAKYDAICKYVFYRGLFFDGIRIKKIYRSTVINETDFYRTVVRVEWIADLLRD